MQMIAGVTQVVFDPRRQRFAGRVHVPALTGTRILSVTAPGHASWDHGRIGRALIAAARKLGGRSDARA